MPVSSLPSKYGIGSFGDAAYKFLDFLSDTGTKCWQVLPMNPTSYGDSPYQSPASVAKNPYFIDLDILGRKGLLTKEQLKGAEHDTERVDYGHLFNTRYDTLRLAYAEFVNKGLQNDAKYRNFIKKNKSWIDDYSLFMSLKVRYDFRPWTEWDTEHRSVTMARLVRREFSDECAFWTWIQFELDEQWRALTDYAHERGILIIGDIPIYVAHDSMDVWQSPEQFLLDEDFMPRVVAGCPPDGFSPDGQLWGNPIYNWDRMESDGFEWWCKRIERVLEMYDIVRIDHFRGFAGYYSIP